MFAYLLCMKIEMKALKLGTLLLEIEIHLESLQRFFSKGLGAQIFLSLFTAYLAIQEYSCMQ